MGRHKKYQSASVMRKAVVKYLRSIQTREDTGLYDLDGNPIVLTRYVIPPEIERIALAIGMCPDTWCTYASGQYGDDFARVCAEAKLECELWLKQELNTREKGVDGIKFNLQQNYGWNGSKHEVEVGEHTRHMMETASMTMDEKLEKLAELPELLKLIRDDSGGSSDDGADDD